MCLQVFVAPEHVRPKRVGWGCKICGTIMLDKRKDIPCEHILVPFNLEPLYEGCEIDFSGEKQ